MAVAAKDGSMHHSAGRAKLHDDIAGDRPAAQKTPAVTGASKGKHPAPSPHSIEDHVAEHGPAIAVHHEHDKAGTGKHHVTTHHGDDGKEMHHSVHDTHEEAHDHIGTAMGLKEGTEEEETPSSADISPDMEEAQSTQGSGIPGLA